MMQPRRKKTLCDNPLLLRFEEISQQQKKAEDELRSRPKKSHPAKFSKKVETSKTSEMSKTEAIRQSKLAVAAAVLKVMMQNPTMCFASCILKKSSAQTNMTVI